MLSTGMAAADMVGVIRDTRLQVSTTRYQCYKRRYPTPSCASYHEADADWTASPPGTTSLCIRLLQTIILLLRGGVKADE